MTDADGEWVEVMKTGPAAEGSVRRALEEAGIPVRTFRPGFVLRHVKGRRSLEVFVPAEREAEARKVLDAHLAQGEANIEQHMKRLPAELTVGLGLVLVVGGVIHALSSGRTTGWWYAAVGVGAFVAGRAWLQAHPR